MEIPTCPALLDGKQCGLALLLVEQDIDSHTKVYEGPLGHRKYVVLGEPQKNNCPALVNGKACGLELIVVEKDVDTATEIYECPLGHRTCSDRTGSHRRCAVSQSSGPLVRSPAASIHCRFGNSRRDERLDAVTTNRHDLGSAHAFPPQQCRIFYSAFYGTAVALRICTSSQLPPR